MHRTLGYLSKRFVQIRPGEGRKVFLTFLYFFLIITSYYLIKPVSRSLILGELGSHMVPYVDLVSAILMGPVVTLFARLVDRVEKPRLVSVSFWVVMGVLVAFWKLLDWPMPWVAGAFYVWVAIFSVLVVTLFWLVANDLYSPREAKRLFGFIGSGGILGGIVGSSIAAVGAQVVGTKHLLLLSSALLLVCWLVVQALWRLAPERATAHEQAPKTSHQDTFMSNVREFSTLLGRSRYLLLLIALVGLDKLVATLTYYQFNPFIEQTFPAQDARTTFTGLYFGTMNVVAFVVQFFLTSWTLRRWGLRVALRLLPCGLLLGTTGLFIFPLFWVAAATELYDGSLNYSLQQTTKEMLYLPIDRSVRYKVKPFIDMVVFRFGKGAAAVIGILFLDVWHLPARWLACVSIPLLILWLGVVTWLLRDYVMTIRTVLQARAASKRRTLASPASEGTSSRAPTTALADSAGSRPAEPSPSEAQSAWGTEAGESFGTLTDGSAAIRKLALVDQLIGTSTAMPVHGKDLMEQLRAYEAHPNTSPGFEMKASMLKLSIADQRLPMADRRRAIGLLLRTADQATVDYLLGIVLVEADPVLRQEAVKGLVKLRRRKERLEFPAQPIRRQIAYEVANAQRIARVASIYRAHARGPLDANDPVLALLRVLLEESMEQIFRLLMLLYHPEDIHLIYEQMRESDPHLRSDAIELLDNLIDPAMRTTIFPILDEDRFLALVEEVTEADQEPAIAYRVLQEAIWNHHCWLSVTTLCAVGRLRLTTMRHELERASRHATPLVAAAAKVALHLASCA